MLPKLRRFVTLRVGVVPLGVDEALGTHIYRQDLRQIDPLRIACDPVNPPHRFDHNVEELSAFNRRGKEESDTSLNISSDPNSLYSPSQISPKTRTDLGFLAHNIQIAA
ncbi:unnamed protein product [Citrullus colocynthis]|uniref:Uncharacterized protein n=1 Tax=Citrullus colocynthis TaxID=252529 RepID=A0ABP0YAL6_9ROSI